MSRTPLTGLLDCNNFFVSCERLFRPDLVGKPVVVLSSNDGCIVARSQEVKDMGVPMGVPYFKIKDTLEKSHVTTFSSHFALYRDISRRVFSVMREELDILEQYSIDEAFFLVSDSSDDTVERVKNSVEQKVGIPVSIGIASTKTQAKYANRLAKKGPGIKQLSASEWELISPAISLADIWGVGGKMSLRFKQHNIYTVADLLAADYARVKQLFGLNGLRLQQELRGVSAYPVTPLAEPQKSILSSRSFQANVTDFEAIADAVAYHVRHAAADLRAMGQKARRLQVMIRPSKHGDFFMRGGTKEVVLLAPSDDTITLLEKAQILLQDIYEVGVPYRKAGICLSCFTSHEEKQSSFWNFDSTASETDNAVLLSIVDSFNKRGGGEVLLLGSRLRGDVWSARADKCSPAYTTRWSDLVTVKAR